MPLSTGIRLGPYEILSLIGRTEAVSYIAMEVVEGWTLRSALADGPLPMDRLITLATQVADGLAAAHDMRTRPGTVMGTLAYMSPEQVCGRRADYRSDQLSFCAILYEIATARHA